MQRYGLMEMADCDDKELLTYTGTGSSDLEAHAHRDQVLSRAVGTPKSSPPGLHAHVRSATHLAHPARTLALVFVGLLQACLSMSRLSTGSSGFNGPRSGGLTTTATASKAFKTTARLRPTTRRR